jgi:hypothetical protein
MSIAATTRPPAFWKSLVQGGALDCGRTSGCPPDPHGAASPGGAVAASVRGKRSTEERPLAAPTKGLLANGRESRRSPALAARFPGGIQDPSQALASFPTRQLTEHRRRGQHDQATECAEGPKHVKGLPPISNQRPVGRQ